MTVLNEVNAQLRGKTYEGRVKYVCKKMVGGGCAITTYCVLTFSEETVQVYYYAKAACTPEEREADYSYDSRNEMKTYKWSRSENVITISGFTDYGTFKYQNNKLISSKGNHEETNLEFSEKKPE